MSVTNNVTLIGLGSMGTALAALLLKNNYHVTVWNRSPEKAQPLVELGATRRDNPAEAIEASDVVVVCVTNYESARNVLRDAAVERALRAKTLIQLSTGTPQDATEDEAWAKAKGIGYVDGAIMVTPSQIGTAEAVILASAEPELFRQVEPLLKTLAFNTVFTGAKASAASALDLAFLSYFFSSLIGFAHAARICGAEGIDVQGFGTMIRDWSPAIGTIMQHCSLAIATDKYDDTQSSLQTCYYGLELIARQAREAQVSRVFPDFATSLFKEGMVQGLAQEDGAAIFKVLAAHH